MESFRAHANTENAFKDELVKGKGRTEAGPEKDCHWGKTHLIVDLWAGILNCGSFWGTDQCVSADIPTGIQYYTDMILEMYEWNVSRAE